MGNVKINERIKELRKQNQLNQKDFASAIGITQSTLSSYENGNALPSIDVLITMATTFHVSIDWICGVSESRIEFSCLSDVESALLQINDIAELRYELEINEHLPNDLETNDNKWFAALKFYGNDPEHKFNMEMCQFLSALQNSRDSLEHYFTDKDNFDTWKSNYLERHKSALLTKKQYEQLTHTEMLKKRNELLMNEFNKSAE